MEVVIFLYAEFNEPNLTGWTTTGLLTIVSNPLALNQPIFPQPSDLLMSLPSSQSSLFEQAEQTFDLGKLRCDLETIGQIDPRDWEFLKGILCGLSQEEIAKQCFVEKGTVKTALSARVRLNILNLLPAKAKVDWKRLPQWLIEAGYGIRENYPIGWQHVCRSMLDSQIQSPTLNVLMAKDGVSIDPSRLFVPIGLIERKQKQYRRSDVDSAEQASQLSQPTEEEIVQRFDQEEDFFNQVIGNPNISDNARFVITGEPGAGKTTLLQKIGDRLDEAGMFPIWISLGKHGVPPTYEFLIDILKKEAEFQNYGSVDWEASIRALLQTGKVWLLLDGADELTTTGNPLQVIGSQLQEAWSGQVKVVLTCRLNAWDTHALPKFKVFRILEFDYQTPANGYQNQIEAYIHQFFEKEEVKSQLATDLIQQLHTPGKERIRDSVKNPLRLSLLCYIWESGIGELPDTRAELYRLFVDYYYDLQEIKNQISIDRTERDALNLALGEVAKTALDSDDSRFRLRKSLIESISVMGKVDAKGSLFAKAVQLGWLNRIGATAEKPYEPAYAFFHASFQEYFAALAIDDWGYFLPGEHVDKPIESKKYRIFEPQWREVVFLWLGKSPGDNHLKKLKEQFLSNLLCFQDNCGGFYSFRVYFLATEGLKEFLDYSISKSEEVISEVLKYAFGYFDDKKREWCSFLKPISQEARKIIRYNLETKQTVKCLLDLLNVCSDLNTRWYIAKTLKNMDITSKEIEEILHSEVKSVLPPHVAKYVNWIAEAIEAVNNNNLSIQGDEQDSISSESTDKFDVLNDDLYIRMEVNDLIRQVQTSDDWLLVLKTAEFLQAKTQKCQLIEVVNALKFYLFNLKNHLSDQLEAKHFRYEYIYEIIWHCAQNISYSDFYQAWHDPISSSDVELSTNNGGGKA